ncbi:MarR family winged helix-turn-helix transcriptional regulator [Sphingomonas sp. IC4-52]|uniref:MarR family winged helix-turn-helix transcriptional regulator n=1 Tax=Sphingomonas sp. IC4-52 TaxID=2887202 RepID=UPI001D125BB4|nr:MarR family transcriptional regulator [Sphingomonas sp. IC4-52]MCC2978835.1 MarR family transcriptional regulator [Sphingomonas sp. IC4-52]MCD2315896.1 MarR family transcriptional regulator [Sphingomonas sp. IC-11]
MKDQVAAHTDDPLRLDRQVCFPLYAATNLINRLYTPVLRSLGITYPQYLVLLVLWEEEPQTVGALGTRLFLDSGTLTPLLKRMESNGLLDRRRDSADERRVLITLTDKGRALREAALHVPGTMSRGYDTQGLEELRERVTALVAILAQHDGRERLEGGA